jgi:hypothetical protein
MTAQEPVADECVAMIEGPNGKAEIYEKVVDNIIEYTVVCGDQTKVFNNLGEAYIEAGDLAGSPTT